MQITCYGAAGCVTGSCFLIDNGKKYLIDCGLFQGGKQMETLNHKHWEFNPREITALFLTHAHIDHSGRIPKLVKDGFRGKIYTNLPTAELCKILLLDSAHIQEMEAEWQTRKNRRRGRPDLEPLYTVADAEACFPLFEVINNNEVIALNSQFKIRFRNAGHILGASVLEVWSGNRGKPYKTVFSGDLGRKDQLIVEDPHSVFDADALFIESTYGNRNHRSFDASKEELLEAIHFSHKRSEKVIIPAFAVERTQEILYILGEFFRNNLIPAMPVYLDSPLAIAATEIFRRMKTFYDEETTAIVNQGNDPFGFPQLVLSRTTDQSIAINQSRGPGIVIAGNGMCTAGRIKHHLKHNLWRPGASLVIVGFQAAGTTGRKIVDGARSIKIFGENIMVRAKIFTIGGFSAHADQSDLLEWISHFENPRMQVYAIHGERNVSEMFAQSVRNRFGFPTFVPDIGELLALAPIEPEALEKAAEAPPWQSNLAGVLQKTQQIKTLLKKSPMAFSPALLQELTRELAETESHLDVLLHKAKRALKK